MRHDETFLSLNFVVFSNFLKTFGQQSWTQNPTRIQGNFHCIRTRTPASESCSESWKGWKRCLDWKINDFCWVILKLYIPKRSLNWINIKYMFFIFIFLIGSYLTIGISLYFSGPWQCLGKRELSGSWAQVQLGNKNAQGPDVASIFFGCQFVGGKTSGYFCQEICHQNISKW